MAITVQIQPWEFSAGYSPIPLKFQSTNVNDSEDFKYIINICYDDQSANSPTAVAYNGKPYTRVTAPAHPYEIGDTLLIIDTDNDYTGYYTVVSIPNTNQFIMDMVISSPVTGTLTANKVLKYQILPDLEGYARLDLSNTIKDFVTQNLSDTTSIWSAPNTYFNYQLYLGEQRKYVVEFEDNGGFFGFGYGEAGKISFYDTSITSLSAVSLSIGDQIVVQQELFEWGYNGAYNDGGYLAFSASANIHNFRVGQPITVNGQVTEPYFNGPATITSVNNYPASTHMTTSKPWTYGSSSIAEGGDIFGVPIPEYNATATIVDLNIDGAYGLVVSTDIPQKQASQPIGGTIKLADDAPLISPAEYNITDLWAFNSKLNKLDYSFSGFNSYVVTTGTTSATTKISTILTGTTSQGTSNKYRIERSSKSYLLVHRNTFSSSVANRGMLYAYDSGNNLLSQTRINYPGSSDYSWFVPVGLNTILDSSTTLIAGSSLSSVIDDVAWYSIAVANSSNVLQTQFVSFELNSDCSRFELFHLMWKDSKGSWLSYPFKYISTNSMEVERSNYYQVETGFEAGSNEFGFDSYDRAETSFFVRSRDKYKLNSGWVEEYENELIKDLMNSPSVYVQLPDNTLVACIIENKDVKFGKEESDYLWNYTIDIKLSNNENRF